MAVCVVYLALWYHCGIIGSVVMLTTFVFRFKLAVSLHLCSSHMCAFKKPIRPTCLTAILELKCQILHQPTHNTKTRLTAKNPITIASTLA